MSRIGRSTVFAFTLTLTALLFANRPSISIAQTSGRATPPPQTTTPPQRAPQPVTQRPDQHLTPQVNRNGLVAPGVPQGSQAPATVNNSQAFKREELTRELERRRSELQQRRARNESRARERRQNQQ